MLCENVDNYVRSGLTFQLSRRMVVDTFDKPKQEEAY